MLEEGLSVSVCTCTGNGGIIYMTASQLGSPQTHMQWNYSLGRYTLFRLKVDIYNLLVASSFQHSCMQ